MDTFSHGLWGGIACGREGGVKGRYRLKTFLLACCFGVAPDLLTFGPRFFQWALAGFPDYPIEPGTNGAPALDSLSPYVFRMYELTHSLIVWALLFIFLWLIFRRPVWAFGAWGFHILCDIPTHTTRYFPTPFLWPLKTPYVNGIAWSQPWFMIANYSLIILLVGLILWRSRR